MVKTLKNIFTEASTLNDYLSSRGINPKFVSRDTKISHAKSAEFQKWKNDRKMVEEIVNETSESDLLTKFLSSKGINAKYATKEMKIAHSKSGEFLKWKRDHMFESVEEVNEVSMDKLSPAHQNHVNRGRVVNINLGTKVERPVKTASKPQTEPKKGLLNKIFATEETDEKDMVCFDIPLLIRVLEFTREEMSSDIELHNMVERLINMRHDVPLDMTHYDEITQKLVKENHIAIAMGKMLDDESGMVLSQIEELERGCAMIRSYIGKDYEKQLPAWVQAKITLATDYMSTVGNYLVSKNEKVNEEVLDEAKKPRTTALEKWRKAAKEREKKHNEMPTGDMKGAIDRLEKHLTKENTLDSMAATEAPCTCSDETNSTPSTGKSYAAKMIKDLKKKTVKEETYDWEKDDKSSQQKPYGKAPKINTIDKKGTLGDTKPEARVVMKGGTTLTGQPRDMVEIDPSMKQRPGQQDKGQNTFTSPIGKKSPSL
jgi:hypothetical protein